VVVVGGGHAPAPPAPVCRPACEHGTLLRSRGSSPAVWRAQGGGGAVTWLLLSVGYEGLTEAGARREALAEGLGGGEQGEGCTIRLESFTPVPGRMRSSWASSADICAAKWAQMTGKPLTWAPAATRRQWAMREGGCTSAGAQAGSSAGRAVTVAAPSSGIAAEVRSLCPLLWERRPAGDLGTPEAPVGVVTAATLSLVVVSLGMAITKVLGFGPSGAVEASGGGAAAAGDGAAAEEGGEASATSQAAPGGGAFGSGAASAGACCCPRSCCSFRRFAMRRALAAAACSEGTIGLCTGREGGIQRTGGFRNLQSRGCQQRKGERRGRAPRKGMYACV